MKSCVDRHWLLLALCPLLLLFSIQWVSAESCSNGHTVSVKIIAK